MLAEESRVNVYMDREQRDSMETSYPDKNFTIDIPAHSRLDGQLELRPRRIFYPKILPWTCEALSCVLRSSDSAFRIMRVNPNLFEF